MHNKLPEVKDLIQYRVSSIQDLQGQDNCIRNWLTGRNNSVTEEIQ